MMVAASLTAPRMTRREHRSVTAYDKTAACKSNIGHLTVWSVLTVQVNCRNQAENMIELERTRTIDSEAVVG